MPPKPSNDCEPCPTDPVGSHAPPSIGVKQALRGNPKPKPKPKRTLLHSGTRGAEGEWFWPIGSKNERGTTTQKRLVVHKFKGHRAVSVREFYKCPGQRDFKAGNRGIFLKAEEWTRLCGLGEDATAALGDI